MHGFSKNNILKMARPVAVIIACSPYVSFLVF